MSQPNLLVRTAIVANTALLVWSLGHHSETLERLQFGFDAFFVVELLVRFAADRFSPRRFFLSGTRWNIFDTAVLVVSLAPVLGVNITVLRIARLARMTHGVRHVSHLRLTHFIPSQPQESKP